MVRQLLTWAILLLALLSIASCSTNSTFSDQDLDAFKNHNKDYLLMKWGSPTKSFTNGFGGEIYTYVFQRWTMAGWLGLFIFPAVPLNVTYSFFIDKHGEVYAWLRRRSSLTPS